MSIVSITLNLKAEVGDCFCIQYNGMCYCSTALYCTPVTNCYFIMRLNLTADVPDCYCITVYGLTFVIVPTVLSVLIIWSYVLVSI